MFVAKKALLKWDFATSHQRVAFKSDEQVQKGRPWKAEIKSKSRRLLWLSLTPLPSVLSIQSICSSKGRTNTHLIVSLAKFSGFQKLMATFSLAFACVAAGLGDFKTEPRLQVADFIYSISWLCFQGCRCPGTCGSGQWCVHTASGNHGSATL